MPIVVICENCRQRFQAEAEREGQRAECPACHRDFQIAEKHVPPFDVFISHASEDRHAALAVRDMLERSGIRCWISSRDIRPFRNWRKAIVEALRDCQLLVCVFSTHANASEHVRNEVAAADDANLPVLTFRVEDVLPNKKLKSILERRQWLNALTRDMEHHLTLLTVEVEALLEPRESVPTPPGATLTYGEVLKQDLAEFEQSARTHIADEFVCDRLVRARRAIGEVAWLFDKRWGRHTLAQPDVLPIIVPPNDRRTTPLALRILHVIVKHLNGVSKPCRIESDEGGLIQKEGDRVQQESGRIVEVSDGGHTWIIDPIDGSRHLMRHLPLFTTTMVLVDEHYEGMLAMIYVPITGELFFAARDHGAYLNHWNDREKLSVSAMGAENAYAYVEFPNEDTPPAEFHANCESLRQIFEKVYRVRGCGLGSLGMAYVAKGAFDAYITLSGKTRRCDVLAGAFLVKEAGGVAQIADARPRKAGRPPSLAEVYAIGGNPGLYDDLMGMEGISKLF
jgi:fructose-1,6-bisphosphatase/inositol monophosphatase family enzyme